jgi:hypothetical protein
MTGHLLRCRCASGPRVRAQYAPVRLLRHPSGTGDRHSAPLARGGFSRRLATHLRKVGWRKSPKGASGAVLNSLHNPTPGRASRHG